MLLRAGFGLIERIFPILPVAMYCSNVESPHSLSRTNSPFCCEQSDGSVLEVELMRTELRLTVVESTFVRYAAARILIRGIDEENF